MNKSFKFCEWRPDGEHADAECAIAQVHGQPFYLLCNRYQFGITLIHCRLAEALLYDYQLPHEVREFIQLVRWHADAGRRIGALVFSPHFLYLLLLCKRRLDLSLRNQSRLNQNVSESLLSVERLLKVFRLYIAPFNQYLAEFLNAGVLVIQTALFINNFDIYL